MELDDLTLYRSGNQNTFQMLEEASSRYGREYVSAFLHRERETGQLLSLTRILLGPEATHSAPRDAGRLPRRMARLA